MGDRRPKKHINTDSQKEGMTRRRSLVKREGTDELERCGWEQRRMMNAGAVGRGIRDVLPGNAWVAVGGSLGILDYLRTGVCSHA